MSDPVPHRRMTPERWALLEPLIDAALDLAPDRRPAFYDEVAANDLELRAELERLVARSSDQDDLFASAGAERFARLFDGSPAPGLTTDILPKLQESLGAAYTLERELGGGGMSRVFLAHEAGLGRRVVIKVLAPELAAGINAERFDREIKLAASLQQANIVPLLATGRAAGYRYYTMPFVEGRSLRDRLAREGVLPIGEAVNLLRDVARALAYAHARGVVHRDIKPGNVLLSGGTAVVTDFGIAKALTAARGEGGDTLTSGGSGIGTPPYMAPEQAAGDPTVDQRADIYGFGCLAYEVFTGKPPFQGDASHLIIAAHFHETPRPVTEGRSDVPPAIDALIAQCLEKNPRRRPQSAAELLATLDAVSSGPTGEVRRRSLANVIRAAAVALAVAIGAGVIGAGAYVAYRSARATEPNATEPLTLTAIPFRNVSRDQEVGYCADGITDEILTALGKVPGIQIVGRNAARRYRDRDVEELAVERELGAVFLMTGTCQERGGRIVVSAQLHDSVSRREPWSGEVESVPGDSRSLADNIARVMALALHTKYSARIGEPKRGALSARATNDEAYQQYLDGQAVLLRRRGVKESIKSFEAAIRLDPKFAHAHAMLAKALTFYPLFYGTPPADVRDTIAHTAQRALALDSTLADAHVAIAMVHVGSGEWDKAAREFERALELEPDNFDIHFDYARNLTMRGDLQEALRQLEQARKLEPSSPLILAWTSYAYFLKGEVDSAVKQSARAVRLDSTLTATTNLGALVNLGTGHLEEARRLIEAQTLSNPMATAPYGYAKLRDTTAALKIVRQMEFVIPRPWSAAVQRATVMLAIGDTARALAALEQSADSTGPMWITVISPLDPAYDPVRQSNRFAALVSRAGLNVASVTARRR